LDVTSSQDTGEYDIGNSERITSEIDIQAFYECHIVIFKGNRVVLHRNLPCFGACMKYTWRWGLCLESLDRSPLGSF